MTYPCYIFPSFCIADGISEHDFVQYSMKKLIFDDTGIISAKYVYAGYTDAMYALSFAVINNVSQPPVIVAANSNALF